MIDTVVDSLEKYISKNDFKGYDPYDTLNTVFPLNSMGRWPQIIAIQLQKRNPINIRPIVGIKKFRSTKGMGLLLSAYINIYSVTKDESLISKIEFIKDWILENSTLYDGYRCWGYDYPYTERGGGSLKKGYPTVIHHSYIIKGLFLYYQVFKDEKILEIILDSKDFVLNCLTTRKFENGICFSYDPNAKGCCYNASMHAAECLARNYFYTKDKVLLELIESALDFVCSRQKTDGSWYYSFKTIDGPEKKQIDFHQGFILESFLEIMDLTGLKKKEWTEAVNTGLDFYYSNQFKKNGQSFWRLPNEYPVDIHNQAQGIITFSKFHNWDKRFGSMANKISDWTSMNMRNNKKGYFYYRNYKYYKHKIPYMRWSQSWMLLALSELMILESEKFDNEKV